MKFIITILRVAVGLLFIFSGVVKANDPLGLTYKMNEFFEVWDMAFMIKYTLPMSVLMIAFEIISGVAMIVGNVFRLYVTLLLLLNIFFTFLTWYALTSGKIKECGCFGDCIKISNTATFYKDVVLTVIVLFLFIFRYRVFPLFNKAAINASVVGLAAVFAFGFQWWTLNHLPVEDCLPYKVGNNITEKMKPGPDYKPAEFATTFIYEKNGVKQEFTMENYPWKDPSWKFVSKNQTEISPASGEPEIHDFSLIDADNNDVTEDILSAEGSVYLWFLREPEKANIKKIDELKTLIAKAQEAKIPFYMVSSVSRDIAETYQEAWGLKHVPFLTLDGTASKTAMRTNPGLMLLRKGTVVNKWGFLDYPKDLVQ
jgi:uncharacterized membrane protein YphA (DoxX/SURF4 family)